MSSKTTNLNLTKPSEDEFYDINVQNENMNIIDREIGGLKQPTYEVSTVMSDLNSGEMITVAFGKIAKAVSTLISHVASKATSSVLGHVKLSDSTSSTSASTAGVAATPKAVKAAYDLANSNTEKIGTTDISGIGDGTVTGAIVNNKEAIEDVTQSLTNINTYVGKDKKLHFVDSSGADTVLPFNSYDDGRIQGRNDVIGSPNSYGLYTKAQYDANKVTYKSGNYNTGLNGETWRSTSFNTGFSKIIALQINCWNDEGNGYFNAFKNVRISGGKVSLDFYAADYVDNYVQWLAVGK